MACIAIHLGEAMGLETLFVARSSLFVACWS